MEPFLSWLTTIAPLVLVLLFFYLFSRALRIFVYIPADSYGVVEKLWSIRGSVRSGLIALHGQAGYQPDLLRTGPHFFLPFIYRVHKQKLITVRGMAYVFARDGQPLPAGQTLARTPENVSFEDVRNFLAGGGQRGPQRTILREGVYAINTAAFIVIADNVTYAIDVGDDKGALQGLRSLIEERKGFAPFVLRGTDDQIGVVTVHDGPALDHNELIAPVVGEDAGDETTFHNSFQYPESFLAAGGRRGRQAQVLVEGTYYINRLFATVEYAPKTSVDVGFVGVVVSYTGVAGADISGDSYRHGALVAKGERGIWAEPLRPGKYAMNPFAYRVVPVPTTNFVLRWIEGRIEDHGLDKNLSEIPMITKDAFEPRLPLSVVVHIAPENAPKIVQQFQEVRLLVNQTIDPIVSAFFKDAAQKVTFLDLVRKRAELQSDAKEEMKHRFEAYSLDLQEVMIGTPRAAPGDDRIPNLLDQLRQREVATEQLETFKNQQTTAAAQRTLNEARATAEAQAALTQSKISIEVANNAGEAELKRQTQQAAAVRVTAAASAEQTRVLGEAEAGRVQAIGLANAAATRAQVEAYTGEGARYQFSREVAERLAEAIRTATVPIVPQIAFNGSGDGANGQHGMVDALLALTLNNIRPDTRS